MKPIYRHRRWIFLLILLLVSAPVGDSFPAVSAPMKPLRYTSASFGRSSLNLRMEQDYGNLPLSFEPNQGQADPAVQYVCRGRGYALFLTADGAVMSLRKSRAMPPVHPTLNFQRPQPEPTPDVIRMNLVGVNPRASFTATGIQPGVSNYFIGQDRSQWRRGIPHYAGVEVLEAYRGINVDYYGTQGQLEFDFRVKPGADPKVIRLGWEGTGGAQVDESGNLQLKIGERNVVFRAPAVYQEKEGRREPVQGRYFLSGDGTAGVEVEGYDSTRELVIDPVLDYGTYLGGTGFDYGNGIGVDAAGNAYLTGQSTGGFPTTAGSFQPAFGASTEDAFVAKLDPTGSTLLYSTYLGGDDQNIGCAIAVDGAGNAYVTGEAGTNFPTTAGAYQTIFGGNNVPGGGGPDPFGGDAFLTELDPTGATLLYSSYLGGSSWEQGSGIALTPGGNVYLTGYTGSANFPTTPGAYRTAISPIAAAAGSVDAFLTELDPAGRGAADLLYSTFLGVDGQFGALPNVYYKVAAEANGDACVVGNTAPGSLTTTPGAYQTTFVAGNSEDTFVMRIHPGGNGAADAVFSTYLGPGAAGFMGINLGYGILLDAGGKIYIAGSTGSANYPTTPGAYNTAFVGVECATVAVLKSDGSSLLYSTFLGTSTNNAAYATAIELDGCGDIYVAGGTSNSGFPTTSDAFQSGFSAFDFQGFLTVLNPSLAGAAQLSFSTFFGTGSDAFCLGLAEDPAGDLYMAGYTNGGIPITAGVYQPTYGGGACCFGGDAFAAKINITSLCLFTPTPTPTITATPTPTPTPTMTPTPVDGYDFYISKNVFNPDNQSVSIHVTFPPASTNNFSLKIYNSAGEFIKQLNKPGQSPPTVDSYSWDGTNMDGQKAADGIYIIYLLEPMASREAKVILLR